MPVHDQRTRTVVHREWTLKLPAHSSDVAKAIAAAHDEHGRDADAISDVEVTAFDDTVLVVGYAVEGADARDAVAAARRQHAEELGALREAHDDHRKRLADAIGAGRERNWDQLIDAAARTINTIAIQRDQAESQLVEARAEIKRFRVANGEADRV